MADGLGEGLLASCILEGSFNEAALHIDSTMLSPPCNRAWEYCLDLARRGLFPAKHEIESRFGVLLAPIPGATVSSICRQVRDRAYISDLRPLIDTGLAKISSGEPSAAVEILLEAAKLRAKYATKKTRCMSYKTAFEERIVNYRLLKESEGILGVASRWPTLNKTTKGFQNGLFHVIAALTSVGKSWFIMILLDDFLQQLRRPLVVSTEMNPIRLQVRLDCVRHKIPFVLLRDALMSDDMEESWVTRMYEESKELASDAIFVGKQECKTVQDVQMLAKEVGASDVIIDGGYRLTRSREWGDQAQVVQDIQVAAEETDIPWIVTTQLGDSSEKGKSFDTKLQNRWNMRYAKEWLIDPDVVLLLSQSPDMKLVKQMRCEIGKWRDGDGTPVDFHVNWDVATMSYEEIVVTADDVEPPSLI